MTLKVVNVELPRTYYPRFCISGPQVRRAALIYTENDEISAKSKTFQVIFVVIQ